LTVDCLLRICFITWVNFDPLALLSERLVQPH
jgi:hypothetical protein